MPQETLEIVQRIKESGADTLITGMDFLQNTALSDQLSRAGSQSSLFIGIMLMLVVYLIPEGLLGLWHRYMKPRAARMAEAPEAVAAGLTAENVEAL